ncbi:zf-HC2 domain-containing protein [Kineococcus sp. NUM-3379]
MKGVSGPHLGARVSALVDGRLRADAAARAEAHVRSCPECADAVETERLVKARLRSLAGPEPSEDLLLRLRGLGGPVGPLRPRERPMPGGSQRPPVAPPRMADASRRPAGRPARDRRRRVVRRPLAAVLVSAFSLVGAGLAGAVLLSSLDETPALPLAQLTWWNSSPAVTQPVSASPDAQEPGASQDGRGR